MSSNLLSISEKREWLARIFRDKTGEYTDADKFKAMEADNRLMTLQYTIAEQQSPNIPRKCGDCTFYFKDHSDPISPGCDACIIGQNPTGVPCGFYSERSEEDAEKKES